MPGASFIHRNEFSDGMAVLGYNHSLTPGFDLIRDGKAVSFEFFRSYSFHQVIPQNHLWSLHHAYIGMDGRIISPHPVEMNATRMGCLRFSIIIAAMQRRRFLQLPLASAAFTLVNEAAGQSLAGDASRTARGFKVESGKSHFQDELLIMDGRFECKVSAKDTGGDLCIYDTYREAKGGPALHVHYHQDEWFYAVRGEFLFRVGEDTFNLRPGDSAFAPRNISHTFAMTSAGEGQMLIVWQPAGSMEDFFYQMSKMSKDIPANQEVVFKKLWKDHGMEVLGPPLKI